MKILIINGTYRPQGTTSQLVNSFIEGVQSAGGHAEQIMLRDQTIGLCTNCLQCYGDLGVGISRCCLKDDMDGILQAMSDADGILFASPVHNGFVTGLMTIFWERLSWRLMRPSDPVAGCTGMKSRIDDKVRAIASLSSAGGMPEKLRKYCDDGTPWLKSNAPIVLHGQWIGDMYAGADLLHLPQNSSDWQRVYFLRRISERQKRRARDLGVKMVRSLQSGTLKPYNMENAFPAPLRWMLKLIFSLSPAYRIAEDAQPTSTGQK